MKFVADESIDQPIVDHLCADGHVLYAVAEMEPGISDEQVLARARQENMLLITADKDFGELIYRQQKLHTGVILLRLAGLSAEAKASIVSRNVQQHETELHGAFTVVTPQNVRIRGGGRY